MDMLPLLIAQHARINMIVKSKMKQVFKNQGVQIPTDTLNILSDDLIRTVHQWAKRAKDGNIKRLKPNDIHLVIGNPWRKILD